MSDILEVNYFLKIERLLITILTSGALNHFHECLVLFLLAAWWLNSVTRCMFSFAAGCLFIYFFLVFFFFDGNVSMIYLRQTFLQEVIIDFVLPSVFLKVLLIFTRCKCLLTIFLILGSEGLHVTEKGMMSTRIDFKFSKKCLLLRLSTLLIWLCILVF